MRRSMLSFAVVLLACGVAQANPIGQYEIDNQNKNFQRSWDEKLEWRFSELPTKGGVPENRIPYAGAIYPDNGNGTVNALWKYDQAFNGSVGRATGYERWDMSAHKEAYSRRVGFFGRRVTSYRVPHWAGHCNGWTAAAIRHAEPEKNVTRNGVVFTPADIKALLAELYVYNENELLGGESEYTINAGTFHVVVTNWLGRKSYAIGMEASPGEEVWNYPMYTYQTRIYKHSDRQVEVQMWVDYKMYTEQEFIKAPENKETKYFHYALYLNGQGEVTGGAYYGDSSQVDLLWVTHKPTQGGTKGNERGNPHMKVEHVLALWRDSVSEDKQNWANVDPIAGQKAMDLAAEEAERARAQAIAAAAEPDDATGVVAVDGGGGE